MKRKNIKKKVETPKDKVRLPIPPPNKVQPDKTKYTRKKKHKKIDG